MQRTFTIAAVWDDEANVFYSKSDIRGFHIEAETVEDFQSLIHEHALELIIENHIKASDFAEKSIKDLLPTIIWQPPGDQVNLAMT